MNLIVARSPIGSSRPGVVYHRVVGARTLPVEAWLQVKPYRLLDLRSFVCQDDINFVRFGPLVVWWWWWWWWCPRWRRWGGEGRGELVTRVPATTHILYATVHETSGDAEEEHLGWKSGLAGG